MPISTSTQPTNATSGLAQPTTADALRITPQFPPCEQWLVVVVLGAIELRPDEMTRAKPKIFTNTPRVLDRKRLLAEIGKTVADLIFCWEVGAEWPGCSLTRVVCVACHRSLEVGFLTKQLGPKARKATLFLAANIPPSFHQKTRTLRELKPDIYPDARFARD